MSPEAPPRVTLLTDFGTADGYAAAMAGLIAAAAPASRVEHASHEVPPGDVHAAALSLFRYAFLYPPGTVHVVVVDPGVGTERRGLAARLDDRYFVAPDNGVLTRVLDGRAADLVTLAEDRVRLPDAPRMSATFHGRDLFAPAAARLGRGESLDSLGPPLDDPVLLDLPRPRRGGDVLEGEVIRVDRFGNLITNIPAEWLDPEDGREVRLETSPEGWRAIGPVRRTYGDVEPGEPLALVGSLDLVEVSVRDGNAALRLGASVGAPVRVG